MNGNSLFVKKFLSVLVIVATLSFCSCTTENVVKKQTEYHEGFEEIEQAILESMGDYICFREPVIDANEKTVVFLAVFITDYIENEQLKQDHNPLLVMEETRLKSNEFFRNNPSFLSGYKITISFSEDVGHYDGYGYIRNYFIDSDKIEEEICFVDYSEIIVTNPSDDVVFEGVKETVLSSIESTDDVLLIVEKMPDIERVYVDDSLIDELSAIRPDIEFL